MKSDDVYLDLCETVRLVDNTMGRLRDIREELVLIARDMPEVSTERTVRALRWVRSALKQLPTA